MPSKSEVRTSVSSALAPLSDPSNKESNGVRLTSVKIQQGPLVAKANSALLSGCSCQRVAGANCDEVLSDCLVFRPESSERKEQTEMNRIIVK